PDPVDVGLQFARGGLLQQVEHLLAVGGGEFTTTKTTNEIDHRWPLRAVVERGAEFGEQDTTMVRRAVAVVAIDDADALETPEPLDNFLGRERPEPLEPREADLVALLAQASHDDAARHGDRALADEHVVCIVGHVLLDEWLPLSACQLVVLPVRLADDLGSAAHRRVVLLADLGHLGLVTLLRSRVPI